MFLDKARTQLKQTLIVPLSQLIENQQTRIVAERAKKRGKVRIKLFSHDPLCNNYVACKVCSVSNFDCAFALPLGWTANGKRLTGCADWGTLTTDVRSKNRSVRAQ